MPERKPRAVGWADAAMGQGWGHAADRRAGVLQGCQQYGGRQLAGRARGKVRLNATSLLSPNPQHEVARMLEGCSGIFMAASWK